MWDFFVSGEGSATLRFANGALRTSCSTNGALRASHFTNERCALRAPLVNAALPDCIKLFALNLW